MIQSLLEVPASLGLVSFKSDNTPLIWCTQGVPCRLHRDKKQKKHGKNRAFCDVMPNRQIAAEGLEGQNTNLEITVSAKRGGAKSGAITKQANSSSENCELLKQVIDAWDDLSPSAKALVAKMVKEFKG